MCIRVVERLCIYIPQLQKIKAIFLYRGQKGVDLVSDRLLCNPIFLPSAKAIQLVIGRNGNNNTRRYCNNIKYPI